MPRSAAGLEFFRTLRSYDVTSPETQTAVAFARTWADLAQRLLCAQAAQAGRAADLPPALADPALRAWLEAGAGFSARMFCQYAPAGWDAAQLELLASSAEWLARAFDPTDPLATSLQVWINHAGLREIQLYGRPGLAAPPPPLTLLRAPPLDAWVAEQPGKPAALIAHYDLHGLAMLALTLRHLQRFDLSAVDCALSFEWTGDISKLWKRAVTKTVTSPNGYANVVMIDCSVHSRQPEYTLKALTKLESAPHCRLVIVDHHVDTALMAPQLEHAQVSVVLTDVLSCGVDSAWGGTETALRVIGALGDKVPEVAAAYPAGKHLALYAAMAEYNRRLIQFSPTPPAMKAEGLYPLRPLWEALAAGRETTPELAHELLGEPPAEEPRIVPAFERVGSLLVVTDKLSSMGRTWYGLLEELMAADGAYYAAALRVMSERHANILLLTDWRAVYLPPVRHFIPEIYLPRCLGHPTAIWADLELSEALPFLTAVATRMNHFLGTPGNLGHAAGELQRNILDLPAPSGA
jgi:hypothetical protein